MFDQYTIQIPILFRVYLTRERITRPAMRFVLLPDVWSYPRVTVRRRWNTDEFSESTAIL